MDNWIPNKIEFPKDHRWHNCSVEWLYFWGLVNKKEFFHFVEFSAKVGNIKRNVRHWSLNGKFYEEADDDLTKIKSHCGYTEKGFYFNTPQIGMSFADIPKPIIHQNTERFGYYSIPFINGDGYIYPNKKVDCVGWLDHEWTFGSLEHIQHWDWLGILLDCGISITAYFAKDFKLCNVSIGDKIINNNFYLNGKHLRIENVGMDLVIDNIGEVKIFNPNFIKRKYSEQPVNIMANKRIIGIGMRERTYSSED